MKFSILIANFNSSKYILECFQSILNQTYDDYEVIILDDFSTDNSVEIIENFIKDKPKFKLFTNQKNEGCGFTKKKLIELAQGDVLGFLDSDDTLANNALEYSVKEYINEEIVGTYSKFMLCSENLFPKKEHKNSLQVEHYNNTFFNEAINISHFFTFKKEKYNLTEGINTNLKVAEDMDLILKLYEQGKLKFIDSVLYNYRIHNNGISSTKYKKIQSKLWFVIVIYEACKRRNQPFNINFALSEIIGFTKKKCEFHNTLVFKILFKIFKMIS